MVETIVTTTVGATIGSTSTGVAHGVTGHLSDGTPVRIRYSSTEHLARLRPGDGGGFDALRQGVDLRFVFISRHGVIGTWRMRWNDRHQSRDLYFGSCAWSSQ